MSTSETQKMETTEGSRECRPGVTALLMLLMVAMGAPGGAQTRSVEPHTEAAVVADDEGWSKAEETGDTAYVDQLLLPEYRSISADGSIHPKAAILAHTKKSSPESTARNAEWKAGHPEKTTVAINGDTAVVTFLLDRARDASDGSKPVMSCDIFVYRDGHWRALYSQHTSAGS